MASKSPQKTGKHRPLAIGAFTYDHLEAIVSVFDKTGLLDLAKGLIKNNVRILASGGTAKLIREGGFAVE